MKGSRLQGIAAEVIQRHPVGIERGVRKSVRIARGDQPSQIYNRSVLQLHQNLLLELETKRQEVNQFSDRIDEMWANVEKLEAKEAKRLVTYRNRLAVRLQEYTETKTVFASKVQATEQREVALNIEERVPDTSDEMLEERETTIEQRDSQLLLREEDVVRREGILDRLNDEIGKLISDHCRPPWRWQITPRHSCSPDVCTQ